MHLSSLAGSYKEAQFTASYDAFPLPLSSCPFFLCFPLLSLSFMLFLEAKKSPNFDLCVGHFSVRYLCITLTPHHHHTPTYTHIINSHSLMSNVHTNFQKNLCNLKWLKRSQDYVCRRVQFRGSNGLNWKKRAGRLGSEVCVFRSHPRSI